MNYDISIFNPSGDLLSVGVLVLPDSNMLSLAATIDPLRAANRRAGRPVFDWKILSSDGEDIPLTTGINISAAQLGETPNYDVLVIVAGFRLIEHASAGLLRRLRLLAPRLQAMGGVDGGSWFLARAGLLNTHTATTHWEDLEEFADAFPAVNVVRDRYTISGKYFTTGGASPAIDMMLHLIRSRLGPELAMSVASAFIYDTVHAGSAPQSLVSATRLFRTAPPVAKAIEMMEQTIEDPMSIAQISRHVGLSARRLETLFRVELGTTPGAYFLSLRLAEARRLVLDSARPLQEIALRSGFASQAVFARAFSREFGLPASTLRRLHRA